MATFDAEVFAEQATTQTGVGDFAGDSWREGLTAYCASLEADAGLNDLGVAAVSAQIGGALANRLRIVDWARRHPAVADERLDVPLVVIGMFRGGTTFLSCLLDQDARSRSLLRWEASDPVPPATPDAFRSGPRVEAARLAGEALEQVNPDFKRIHHEEPDGPTECVTLLAHDFKSLLWETVTNVRGYSEWLFATDETSAYDYHHLALQVLQSGGVRGRWTLKSPHHVIALEELTTRYPDAQPVILHRDPTALVASVCSLIRTLTSTFSDADHSTYIREHWTWVLSECFRRLDSFRETHPERPILDVHYADLVRDPLGVVRTVYEASDMDLDGATVDAVTAYVAAHPRGEFGAHRYDFAELGLDEGELRERFAGYVERYGVAEERQSD